MDTERFGVCRLTGTRGKFVRSHLLPRAFTKPIMAGAALFQAGNGERITRRFDSWYDQGIVTRDGEAILEKIDDAAIKELRRHKLVWSSWGDAEALPAEDHRIFMPPAHGIRQLRGLNVRILRTFCLSLLWRAAVTSRFEFADVRLPEADVGRLSVLIVSGEWGPADFYPATLVQLSTLGLPHNMSPIVQTKHNPAFGDVPGWSVEIVRFYMDGLMLHIHKHAESDGKTAAMGPIMIGGDERLIVTTVTYEQSFEAENFAEVVARSKFPDSPRPGGGQWPAGSGPRTKLPR